MTFFYLVATTPVSEDTTHHWTSWRDHDRRFQLLLFGQFKLCTWSM